MAAIAILLVVMVAAGMLCQFAGVIRGARLWPPPGRMIDAGGHRLHVLCSGSGHPSVVFESGIAASSLSWTRVVPQVAAFTHCCAYDRAGLGWSEVARERRTLPRMIEELRTVLAGAGHGPYVLVGHSFGALLVCAYASRRPEQIAGIVLLDPPSEWQQLTREQACMVWGGIQLSRIGAVLAQLGVVRACLAFLSGGAPQVPRTFVRVFGSTAARTLERLVGEVRKPPPEVHPTIQSLRCQPKCFRAMADYLAA